MPDTPIPDFADTLDLDPEVLAAARENPGATLGAISATRAVQLAIATVVKESGGDITRISPERLGDITAMCVVNGLAAGLAVGMEAVTKSRERYKKSPLADIVKAAYPDRYGSWLKGIGTAVSVLQEHSTTYAAAARAEIMALRDEKDATAEKDETTKEE